MRDENIEKKENKEKEQKKQKKRLVILCVLVAVIVIALAGIVAGKMMKTGENKGESTNQSTGSQLSSSSAEILQTSSGASSGASSQPSSQTPLQAETVTPGETDGTDGSDGKDNTSGQTSLDISADSIYSSNALLVRLSDHAVLLDKGGEDIIYPASMTKIMTALVAIEALPDLDENIQITAEQINPLYLEGASLAGFSAGEVVTVRDLLYGVLLPSGAEACVALADRVAGSETAFVELMNQKAQELGLSNTHFVTDSGLHDDNHYTTCADLAALLEYALSNETFRTVFTAHSYTCTPTDYHPEGLYLASTLFQKLETDTLANGAVIEGGKTGYTEEAQLCLASLASFQGQEYILITAHAEGNHYTEQFNLTDACSVYGQLKE